jgi:ubiquinone/menaquinone biosynthesis C-methylase UbiE
MVDPAQQQEIVIDQFTKQAIHFAKLPGHADADRLLMEMANVNADSEVLDVACGPGLVACAFSPHVRRVTGIDVTPAMIDRAKALQADRGLANLDWHIGDVTRLPFPDGRFDIVLTRYSLHHLIDPQWIVAEMVRVARPGGRVLLADLVLPPEKAEAYDYVERLRDPSHVRVLSQAELQMLVSGLADVRTSGYQFELGLEQLLTGSFPNPDDDERVRLAFEQDVGVDRLGVGACRISGNVQIAYPIFVVVGTRLLA